MRPRRNDRKDRQRDDWLPRERRPSLPPDDDDWRKQLEEEEADTSLPTNTPEEFEPPEAHHTK
jgi:hypothetical protein